MGLKIRRRRYMRPRAEMSTVRVHKNGRTMAWTPGPNFYKQHRHLTDRHQLLLRHRRWPAGGRWGMRISFRAVVLEERPSDLRGHEFVVE